MPSGPGLEPLTRVAGGWPSGLFINVKNHGALGNGTTDDRAAIQAADTAAATIGAAVYFPGAPNGYLVTGSVRPSSGATWFGDGYNSLIKCPDAGWLLVSIINMGIINIENESNIRLTGLRVRGTKIAPIDASCDAGNDRNCHTPKLVYLETYTKVTIDHCWFENSFWEGIWEGGPSTSTNRELLITNNYFEDIGWDIGVAAPGITLNCEEVVVSNNIFYHVGQGVGASGARIAVVGNEIKDVSGVGISTGDAGESGVTTIASNVIELTEGSAARRGILLEAGSGDKRLINVVGNVVRLIGTAALGNATCYQVGTAQSVNFANNFAEIQVRGVGFSANGSTAGTSVSYKDNTVRIVSESGASYGFRGQPNGAGQTLNLVSSNNRVYGATRAQGSFAYFYSTQGGGTLSASMAGDFTTEGNLAIGDTVYNQFGAISTDNKPMFDNSSLTSFSAFLRYPELGILNFQAPFNTLTIAGGAITLAGSSSSYPLKQTRIKIDTEGAAGTDDLDSINGAADGDLLIIQTIDSGRDVTVKHNTGNILCASDFTLSSTSDRIVLLYDGGLSKWIELSRWSPTLNVATAYQVAGTKIVGARKTGWGSPAGTLSRAAYTAYAGQTVSNPPTQAEMQTLDDAVKLLSQTVAALLTDLHGATSGHGVIGT